MSKLSDNARQLIEKSPLFLIVALSFGVMGYIFNPVPWGYLLIAVICGAISFAITAWYWRQPQGWVFVCLILLIVIPQGIARHAFHVASGFFIPWLPALITYLSAHFSVFFLLMMIFKKKLISYLAS